MSYIEKFFNLKNKVVVIIGAAGFLCSELAYNLSLAGCKVILLDINKKKLLNLHNKIIKKKLVSAYYILDVKKKSEHIKALDFVLKKFGKVDVLINGANLNASTPFLQISEEEWNSILAVQLNATMFACQIFGEQMLKQSMGSIINFSSTSSGPPLSKAFTYSVAKAGVKNLTQNLAREWGTKNVRVNSLKPGFFPTKWSMNNFIDKKRETKIFNHTPMKRYGKPIELIGAVLWLASDSSTFVTGAEIAVDGGFSSMTI